MSTDADAETVAILKLGFTECCCAVAACTIYSYYRALTISREVNLIWCGRSMSLATGLYFLLHLSIFVCQYLNVAMLLITSCKRYGPAWSRAALIYSSCSGYITSVVQAFSNSLFHVTNGGFTALRAYAIGGRSILLASVIIVSSLLSCAFNIYNIFAPHDIIAVPWPVGCVISPNKKVDVFRIMVIMGEAFALVSDVLLVAATWRHASIIKIANDVHVKTPVTLTLLRDGTLYFVAISVVLIINTTLSVIDANFNDIFMPLGYSLQVILISHFYLNLHEANLCVTGGSSNASQMSDLRFTRVVGHLAGSLAYNTDDLAAEGTDTEDNLLLDEELGVGQGMMSHHDDVEEWCY